MKDTLEKIFLLIAKIVGYFKYSSSPYLYPKKAYQRFCEDEMNDSYLHFKKYFYTSLIMNTKYIKTFTIKRALEKDNDDENFYLEFGVHKGISLNLFSKHLKDKKIYGFDGFVGLKEDWVGTSGGLHLDEKGKIPKLRKNAIPVKGWIQDTLEPFIDEKGVKKIIFANIDVDTYETTKFILQKIKPFLCNGSIIIFDEIYNFPAWKVGEYKALTEEFDESEYKFFAFAADGKQAVIEIIKS